jgi:NAD(P)-dependent dehydrogenase (short-subunit alcohol dehydrogenase family)
VPTRPWFAGRVAIVTGASRGIGRAIAQRFADEGCSLVLTAHTEPRLFEAAEDCRARGADVRTLAGDLSDEELPARLADLALASFGRLDVLVANAFWDEVAPITRVSLSGWERTLRVTLTAPMLLARAVIPAMRDAGGGSIVMVGSQRAISAGHGMPAYEAAKAGLSALTRSLAIEHGGDGIRANCVSPGLILSERARDWLDAEPWRQHAMDTVIPLGRAGRPDELANVVAFVASDEASFVNGAILWVDGGALAGLPENAALELAQQLSEDAVREHAPAAGSREMGGTSQAASETSGARMPCEDGLVT